MAGDLKISDLHPDVARLVKERKIDTNNDGSINEDNGELASLLSACNVTNVEDLYNTEKLKRDKKLESGDYQKALGYGVAGTGVFALGKYLRSEKFVEMGNARFEKQQRLARIIEKRFQPSIAFNFTEDDVLKFYENVLKERRLKPEQIKNELAHIKETLGKPTTASIEHMNALRSQMKHCSGFPTRYETALGQKSFDITIRAPRNFLCLFMTPTPDEFDQALDGNPEPYLKRVGATRVPGRVKTPWLTKVLNNLEKRPLYSQLKGWGGLAYMVGSGLVAASGYFALRDVDAEQKDGFRFRHSSSEPDPIQPKPTSDVEHLEIKEQFIEGFKKLGISEDTEMAEYVPQKGEFWISILKAKYDVDDATAQKMANKIKEAVYDDPKASKQTPVMYLPMEWNFENNNYKYNVDAIPEKTDEFSDDVTTEMGKMRKDIRY